MNKKKLAIAALAAAVVAIAALAASNVAMTADPVATDDYEEPAPIAANDYEDPEEEELTGAGGGGWFRYDGAKNTFGFYLNSTDESMSELVLQARDLGVMVLAYQFDAVAFSYDAEEGTGSAEAWGRAWIDGVDASFHLIVEDNGHRSLDRFVLEVTTDVTHTWDVTGIAGGQIWVYLE